MRTVDPAKWPRQALKPLITNNQQSSYPEHPPGPLQTELRLRNSFQDAVREYIQNCSIRGFGRITGTAYTRSERRQHMLALAACMVWGVVVVCWRLQEEGEAVRGGVRGRALPVRMLPFPAVALCSACVIANTPLHNYTLLLESRTLRGRNSSVSRSWIRRSLLQFGSLLTLGAPAVDVAFSQFLARTDPALDVERLMYYLSLPCSGMLVRCSWRGRPVPCELLFSPRATPLGYCCVFNARYFAEDAAKPTSNLDMVGRTYGLTVIVYQNPDEYAFVRRASAGGDV